jgi:nitrate reductase gamma subunit
MASVEKEISNWWKTLCGSKIWQVSIGILVLGHLAALLLPQVLLQWNANPIRLYLLEGFSLVVGVAATLSTITLMWRHLGQTNGSILSEAFDAVFLALIFVGLLSGIGIAVSYRWGSSWAAITLAPWLASFLRGRPAVNYILEMPPLIRLHVFCAFAAIAVTPLTRLSLVFVYAVDSGLRLAGQSMRPITALGHSADIVLHNLSSRLWPEED